MLSVSLNICQTTTYMSKCNLSSVQTTTAQRKTLLRVCNDLLCILDVRKAAILVLLCLSAAFDTIDHTIMLTRLRGRFGITATCLAWIESYLANRSHRFKCTAEYQRNVQWCSAFSKVPFLSLSCLFATLLHSVISHFDTE